MVPRVRITGVPVGSTPDRIREILGQSPHTRYPIIEGDLDHIVGMIHIKDLLRLLLRRETIGARHARPLPLVPETAPLDAVLATMRQRAVADGRRDRRARRHGGRRDARGSVRGSDRRNRRRARRSAARLHRDAQGRLRVPGTMRIDELGQQFDLELEHEDVDSVSGLVLDAARPAAAGRRHRQVRSARHRGDGARRARRRRVRRDVDRTGTASLTSSAGCASRSALNSM